MNKEIVYKLAEDLGNLVGKADWLIGVGIGGTEDNPKVVVAVKDKKGIVEAKNMIATVMAEHEKDIEIMEVGEIVALTFFPTTSTGSTGHKERVRPLEAGISIGDSELKAACTMTGVFTDGKEYYILTNAHCLKGATTCKQEDLIDRKLIQPALVDGGDPKKDVVAGVIKASNIMNPGNSDTAVARIAEGVKWTSKIYGTNLKSTGEIVEPKVGMLVTKSGRSSGITYGIVLTKKFKTTVRYPCGLRVIENMIVTSKMLDPGDSGSPVFDEKGNFVGQAFAGSELISLVIPASTILKEFNLRPAKEPKKEEKEKEDIISSILKYISDLVKEIRKRLKKIFKIR